MHMIAWREKAQSGQQLTKRASQEPGKASKSTHFPRALLGGLLLDKIKGWEPKDQLPAGGSTETEEGLLWNPIRHGPHFQLQDSAAVLLLANSSISLT